jgi:hypothetical protein
MDNKLTDNNLLVNYISGGKHISLLKQNNEKDFDLFVSQNKIDYTLYRQTLFECLNQEKDSNIKEFYIEHYKQISLMTTLDEDIVNIHGKYLENFLTAKLSTKVAPDQVVDQILGNNKNCVIIFDGLPMSKSKETVMKNIFSLGFDVYYPYHPGAMATQSILNLESLQSLNNRLVNELSQKYENVYFIGVSFGGFVCSVIDLPVNLKGIVLFSPAFNFGIVSNIETLPDFIESQNGHLFKIDKQAWPEMIQYSIENTANIEKFKKVENVRLVFGNQDKDVPIEFYQETLDKYGIYYDVFDSGHIGLSRLYLSHYLEIIEILN